MAEPHKPTISLIIPTDRADDAFERCLAAIKLTDPAPDEVIVVVDGGDEAARTMAASFGATVTETPVRGGPAGARNIGARLARGDVLFFVDADVLIPPDSVGRVASEFQAEPQLAALFGSYDTAPDAPNFFSQYKNLLHHYVHQTAHEEASTFWSGCGAVRRDVFLGIGGYDVKYPRPSIEDIELGYRLRAAGHRIRLLKSLQAKHLKCWTMTSLLYADFFGRAVPWSEIILRTGGFVNDLNVTVVSRLCVMLVYVLLASLLAAWRWPVLLWLSLTCAAVLLVLNLPLYRFFARQRGLRFAVAAIPWHWLYYLYSGLAFAIAVAWHFLKRPFTQEIPGHSRLGVETGPAAAGLACPPPSTREENRES
jgi:glycosyltransferase involved in cell wall biosynthesis